MDQIFDNLNVLCENSFENILEPQQVYNMISNHNQDYYSFFERAKNISQQCQYNIKEGEIAYVCNNCCQETTFQICQQCFDPNLHQDHLVFKSSKQGACCCGNLEEINQEGSCKKHSNSPESQQIELEVPQELQINLENSVVAAAKIFCNLMKQIETQWQRYSFPIMQLYHLCYELNINKITKLLNKKIQYENYYMLLKKSYFIHQSLFKFLYWLTDDSSVFQSLVAKILQKKLSDQSASIYEEIMQFQVLHEYTSPDIALGLESLIIRLNQNQDFLSFVSKTNLEMISKFCILAPKYEVESISDLNKFLEELTERQKNHDLLFFKKNKKYITNLENQALVYLDDLNKIKEPSEYFYMQTESIYWWFKCEEPLALNTFIENVNQSNVIEFLKSYFDKLHQPQATYTNIVYPLQVIKSYNRKFRNFNFDELNMEQFKKVAGEYYEVYLNQDATSQQIDEFKIDQFIITRFIETFRDIKPAKVNSKKNSIGFFDEELEDTKAYYCILGETFSTVKTGFLSIFASKTCTQKLEMNFIKIVLKQTYYNIKNFRNKFSNFEDDINDAYQKCMSKAKDEKQQFERERRILMLQIKNASITEKIFTFVLALHFVKSDYQSPADYLNFLQDLFRDSQENIYHTLHQILKRCIQNYITFWISLNDEVDQLYYGYGDGNQRVKIEAFDTCFIKFYLYFYGKQGLIDFHSAIDTLRISNIQIVSQSVCLLLNRILVADIDIYELVEGFFNSAKQKLPQLISLALQKVIQNIFTLQPECSYDFILQMLEQLGVETTKNKNDYFLDFVELDLNTKLFKLRKEYQPIYDPTIFNSSPKLALKAQTICRDKNMAQLFECFGDGLLWDLLHIKQKPFGPLRTEILKELCSISYINDTIKRLIKSQADSVEEFMLTFYQLVGASDLQREEFKHNMDFQVNLLSLNNVCNNEFSQVFIRIQFKENYINQFLNLLKNKIEEEQKQEQAKNLGLLEKQAKVCTKHNCKLDLAPTQRAILIFKNHRPKELNQAPQLILNKKTINLCQLEVQSCEHLFHANCLSLLAKSNKSQAESIPSFLEQWCSMCNQSFNFQLSITKNLLEQELQIINKNLIDTVFQLGMEKYYYGCYENNTIDYTVDIYLQIIIHLINQLFIDTNKFIKFNYSQIFNQIFYLLQLTLKQNGSTSCQKEIKIENNDENNFISQIVQTIFTCLIRQENILELKKQMTIIIQKLSSKYNKQLVQQLCNCFEIQEKLQIFELQQQQQLPQQNSIILDYYTLKQNAQNKINEILGANFQEFNDIQQNRLKNYSKLIDIDLYSDIHLCLLCLTYVFKQSNQIEKIENLDAHTQKEHAGASFFVCINDGNCSIVLPQVPVKELFNLYYHQKVGCPFNQQEDQEWDEYVLDQLVIQNIVNTIITNSYANFIRNHYQSQTQ